MDFGLTITVNDTLGASTLVDVSVSGGVVTISSEQSLSVATRSSLSRYVLNLLAVQGLVVDQFIWSDDMSLSS